MADVSPTGNAVSTDGFCVLMGFRRAEAEVSAVQREFLEGLLKQLLNTPILFPGWLTPAIQGGWMVTQGVSETLG